MKAYKAKMKKINARKPKNWKIDSATALINSLYGTLGQRTVFGNLWRTPRSEARSCDGYPPEGSKSRKEQKDTSLEAQKDTKSQRIPPLKAQSGKRDAPKAKMEAERLK